MVGKNGQIHRKLSRVDINNLYHTQLTARIFRHLKLELLTQFPASNDEKYLYFWKVDISLTFVNRC